MTLHPDVTNAVREWINRVGKGAFCTGADRETIITVYRDCYPEKTRDQAENAVSNAARRARGTVILKTKKSAPLGQLNSLHPARTHQSNAWRELILLTWIPCYSCQPN